MKKRFLAVPTIVAFAAVASLFIGMGMAVPAHAQGSYPGKPIRMIVGLAAGGGVDLVARLIAPKLSEALGQPVIVENRPGGNTVIVSNALASAPADGYTLYMAASGSITINPVMFAKLAYAPRDFSPVSLVCTFPLVLVANSSLPIKSVQDLVAFLKANPAKANYSGSSAAFQLPTELFKQRTGITQMEFIQYKGSNEAVSAVMSGDVAMTLVDTGPAIGALKGDRVRALAVTSPRRLSSMPDVPTMRELGFPELELQYWMGLFVKSGTPQGIVKKLEAEINRIVKLPDIREALAAKLFEATGSTSEELARTISTEVETWESVRKGANMKHLD